MTPPFEPFIDAPDSERWWKLASMIGLSWFIIWNTFPFTIPIRFGRWLFVSLGLMGCAGLGVIDETHLMVNELPPCLESSAGACHTIFPSRAELAAAERLECTGYVMAKAYALAAQGISTERMQVAVYRTGPASAHAVLVIDGQVVLDNLKTWPTGYSEYLKFNPLLREVPWRASGFRSTKGEP